MVPGEGSLSSWQDTFFLVLLMAFLVIDREKGGKGVWRGEEGEQRHSLVLLGYRSVDQCSIPALSFVLGPMSKYSHHGGRRQVHRHQTQLRPQQLCLDLPSPTLFPALLQMSSFEVGMVFLSLYWLFKIIKYRFMYFFL